MPNQTDPDIEQGSHFRTPTKGGSPGPQTQISPADTFDTALTSPSTFDSADSRSFDSPKPQKVSFEHHIKTTSKSRGGGLLLGISKPLLGVTLLFLAASAAVAYLLNGWLKIPQLNEEIERLEEQVNILNMEVNRLSMENDRYSALNDKLNITVSELTNLTVSLNATVIELEDVTDALNETNKELSQQVDDLTRQNERYENLNESLNSTALYLSAEVGSLKDTLSELMLENDALSNLTTALEGMTDRLSNITAEQNETLIELQTALQSFTAENDRLQGLNSDLLLIVGFLNETSVGIDDNLAAITDYLASQIEANQALLLESLENTYRQRVASWDCDYRDVFREQPFGTDFDTPISDKQAVLSYVDDRVLSELCLDSNDFDTYLSRTFPNGLTSHRLIRGVVQYTTLALDYYFPESGEQGLSPHEWSEASFSCDKLSSTYIWS